MTNDSSLESSHALLIESAKKFPISFFAKSSYKVKMFAKKMINIHFWKALDHVISNK